MGLRLYIDELLGDSFKDLFLSAAESPFYDLCTDGSGLLHESKQDELISLIVMSLRCLMVHVPSAIAFT